MALPLISIVIPAYNAARTLKQTLQSVFDQTIQDFEVIIVDDGSTDNTLSLANSIAASDSRVKVISQKNGGASAARNTGIKQARGRYIALLDADDLWVPHKLERQIAVLREKKDVHAVQSGAYFVNDSLEILSVRPCFQSKDPFLETLLFQNLPNVMSTTVIEREVFDKVGYFDTELSMLEDWEWVSRLARFANLYSIEEPLSLYRVHIGNRSRDIADHVKPGSYALKRIFADPNLPEHIRKQKRLIYSAFYLMLCGGSFNVGNYGQSLKWGVKAMAVNPRSLTYIARLPLRRLQRSSSREQVLPEQLAVLDQMKGKKASI